MTKSCIRCGGTGMYMGNGMIMTSCDRHVFDTDAPPTLDKIDRRSKDYRDAINDIMTESNISRIEAEKVFDEAYVKG